MKLTDNNKRDSFWREPGNRLFLEIDGKPYELKYTVYQHEAYLALVKDNSDAANRALQSLRDGSVSATDYTQSRINDSFDFAGKMVEVALNPTDEKQITHSQVMELFEERLDLLKIVSRTYAEKKILNPALCSALDPLLAPAQPAENGAL